MLAISLSLGGCIGPGEAPDPNSSETTAPTDTTKAPLPILQNPEAQQKPSYRFDIDESLLTTDLDPAYLLLVNKQSALGDTFVPADLADIPSDIRVNKQMKLNTRALEALKLMMQEMKAEGITDTLVTSAYRSYLYQAQLYNGYIEKEMSGISPEAYAYLGTSYISLNYTQKGLDQLSRADAERVVDSYSSKPGYSEHQSGLCVDFIQDGKTTLDESFEDTAAFEWLSKNAYRFGFILRYPKEKESITGYSYEPWHYRFVGREAATEIYAYGYTLEEYLNAKNA